MRRSTATQHPPGMATARREENKMATITTMVPSTPNAMVSNCSQGGRDEDKKDKDEGEGRNDNVTMRG
jgi:hypothetical protein